MLIRFLLFWLLRIGTKLWLARGLQRRTTLFYKMFINAKSSQRATGALLAEICFQLSIHKAKTTTTTLTKLARQIQTERANGKSGTVGTIISGSHPVLKVPKHLMGFSGPYPSAQEQQMAIHQAQLTNWSI